MNEKEKIISMLQETLSLSKDSFVDSIAVSRMLESMIWIVVEIVLLFLILYFVKKFNREFEMRDNLENLFSLLRKKDRETLRWEKEKEGKNKNIGNERTDKKSETFSDEEIDVSDIITFSDIIEKIKTMIRQNNISVGFISFCIALVEIHYIFSICIHIIKNIIVIIQCNISKEQIFLEYVSKLLN